MDYYAVFWGSVEDFNLFNFRKLISWMLLENGPA